MKYRPLNLEEDYNKLKEIWECSPMKVAPAIEMLSPNGIVVTYDNEAVIGALFNFYIVGTQIALIGYPILDKYSAIGVERDIIVDNMFMHAEFLALSHGYKYAQTYSSLKHIDERLEKNGWIVGDPNATNYFKKL